jgi:hypothetical protein
MEKILDDFKQSVNTPALRLISLLNRFLTYENTKPDDVKEIKELLPCFFIIFQ